MAVPKRKTSKQRKNKRRSAVWKLEAPTLAMCPNCKEPVVAHRVCENCGFYDGKEVIKKEASDKKEA